MTDLSKPLVYSANRPIVNFCKLEFLTRKTFDFIRFETMMGCCFTCQSWQFFNAKIFYKSIGDTKKPKMIHNIRLIRVLVCVCTHGEK